MGSSDELCNVIIVDSTLVKASEMFKFSRNSNTNIREKVFFVWQNTTSAWLSANFTVVI